jgi:hypothetical protein
MSDAGRTDAASVALYARYGAGVDAWRVVGQSFAEIALAAADKWDAEHRWVRIQLDPDEVDVGAQGEAQ